MSSAVTFTQKRSLLSIHDPSAKLQSQSCSPRDLCSCAIYHDPQHDRLIENKLIQQAHRQLYASAVRAKIAVSLSALSCPLASTATDGT